MREKGFRTICVLAVLLALGLGSMNLLLGDLNQDEGWYLYAAKLVAGGELPYRDFAFTQAPVMPFVYTVAMPLVRKWGVAGGRAFTMMLGLLGAGLAAWTAYRLIPVEKKIAALTTFILITANCYHSYYSTVVKTYALCAFFLVAGFLMLTWVESRRGVVATVFAGVFMALAAGTRISAVVCLPIVLLWLLLKYRRKSPFVWVGFGVGGIIAGAIIFLPLCLMTPDSFWFFNVGYHSSRATSSGLALLMYKAGFVSRWAQGYSVAFFLAVTLGIFLLSRFPRWRRMAETTGDVSVATGPLWLSVLAMSTVHFMASFPYEDYQVALFPILAIALSVGITQMLTALACDMKISGLFLSGLLIVSAIATFSSPINQNWMVLGRDRIWWRIKDKPDILKLREVGLWLREVAGDEKKLITQDIYLAVESGLDVPSGMEMGPFCYYPEVSDERAECLNVVNRAKMESILNEFAAPVAAVSAYGFAIDSPAVTELDPLEQHRLHVLLENRYELVREIPNFGQGHTPLSLYRLKK